MSGRGEIQYEFKHAKSGEHRSITFSGMGIALSELKKAIIAQEGLGPTEENPEQLVDLEVENAITGESLRNRRETIMSGTPIRIRLIDNNSRGVAQVGASTVVLKHGGDMVGTQLASAATEDGVERVRRKDFRAPIDDPHALPPEEYLCKVCGASGKHYSQYCPLQGNTNVMRRNPAAGVPTSMYRVISARESDLLQADGADVVRGGLLVRGEKGDAVVMTTSSFSKHRNRAGVTSSSELEGGSEKGGGGGVEFEEWLKDFVPDELRCVITNGLAVEAATTPCCGETVNATVFEKAVEEDGACPNCLAGIEPGDSCVPNEAIRRRAVAFRDERLRVFKAEQAAKKSSDSDDMAPANEDVDEEADALEEALKEMRQDSTQENDETHQPDIATSNVQDDDALFSADIWATETQPPPPPQNIQPKQTQYNSGPDPYADILSRVAAFESKKDRFSGGDRFSGSGDRFSGSGGPPPQSSTGDRFSGSGPSPQNSAGDHGYPPPQSTETNHPPSNRRLHPLAAQQIAARDAGVSLPPPPARRPPPTASDFPPSRSSRPPPPNHHRQRRDRISVPVPPPASDRNRFSGHPARRAAQQATTLPPPPPRAPPPGAGHKRQRPYPESGRPANARRRR